MQLKFHSTTLKRIGIWLKNDLRIRENPLIDSAIRNGFEIIPFYCLHPGFHIKSTIGMYRMGFFRTKFLFETLKELDSSFRSKGSGVLFRYEDPVTAIPELVKYYGIETVYLSDEFAPEELSLILQVEQLLVKLSCRLVRTHPELLLPLRLQPFLPQAIPEVFTAYRQKAEKIVIPECDFSESDFIASPELPELILPSPGSIFVEAGDSFNFSSDSRFSFKAGEQAAHEQLHEYSFVSDRLAVYKETRNGLLGNHFSSRLSAWLSNGTLSASQVYKKVKDYERSRLANESTYWLVFELRWRDFFRLTMLQRAKQMFALNGFRKHAGAPDGKNMDLFNRWKNGQTGQDFVDACMLELASTGYLSNRGRQIAASYLVDYLKLDWRLGAAWFEQELVDYDASSNWGNWAYIAGVGNDPRGKRVFNPERQAELYDPDGSYRKYWLSKH
jgi:deoxyribodipyrimidine photo-lyase